MRRLLFLCCLLFVALFVSNFNTLSLATEKSIGAIKLVAQEYIVDTPQKVVLLPDTIRFVGDVLLARRVETLMDSYGRNYPFAALPKIATTTVLVGNFESAIPPVHVHTPDFTFAFSVDTENLQALNEYGFSHMSLANNHSYDYGATAFSYATSSLASSSIVSFGNPVQLGTSSVTFVQIDQLKTAIIGINAVSVLPTNLEIASLMDYAKTQSVYQIVYVHWGTEYDVVHSQTQEELAMDLIDAGANAIIGHHPHVVQDVALYNDVPVFYSLGNFVFDQYFSADVQVGLMIDIVAKDDNFAFALLPVTSIGSQSRPRLMSGLERDIFLKNLAIRSQDSLSDQIKTGQILIQKTQ